MPHYIFHSTDDSSELNIIFPGCSLGFQTGFINKIFNTFVTNSKCALSYNYPFLDRGQETSSGPGLIEELSSLEEILKKIDIKNFNKINFIGKSLGAIIASEFLKKKENNELLYKSKLFILGYVIDSINISDLKCDIVIIQGENDRFGNIEMELYSEHVHF